MKTSPPQLETEVLHVAGRPVLCVRGEIDIYTAPVFRRAVTRMMGRSCTELVLDFSGVTFMDSSAIGTLLGVAQRLRGAGGELHLAGVSPAIGRVLRLTRLDRHVRLHDTVADAIREPVSA